MLSGLGGRLTKMKRFEK